MKKIKNKILLLIAIITISTSLTYAEEKCYQDIGCFQLPKSRSDGYSIYNGHFDEIISHVRNAVNSGQITIDPNKKFTGSFRTPGSHYGVMQFINGVVISYFCNNGWGVYYYLTACSNGANNSPDCNICDAGADFVNNACQCKSNGLSAATNVCGCANGAENFPQCNQCPSGSNMVNNQCVCTNGATGAQCNICPSGQVMQNNLCVCANGATNPPSCNTCPAGSNMVSGSCVCNNDADVFKQCNACKDGQVFNNSGKCVDGCSTTNACGQTITGFMNNGRCELSTGNGVDPNASCIVNFNVTSNTVNPNGSVEFSWTMAPLPSNIRSKCGFIDLTTPTPRPIPGLQNLDPSIDKVRINNVQATTRFCLVCQFYNLLNNNSLLGEAVKHQWVRVIRVGEN
jgi:hypothetical protein